MRAFSTDLQHTKGAVWLGLALAFGLSAPVHAQDEEEILSYDVVISLESGGWMEVREEITVRALGREIRRGIYRDFPTRFPRESGLGKVTAPFQVVEVLRDGQPEPFITESVGGPAGRGGIRVRIGSANRLLPSGEHTYVLTYRTARWFAFGEDRDRLYWNVTGNGWAFPILSASARILLPPTGSAGEIVPEGWTGPEGSTASNLTAVVEQNPEGSRSALFRTTAPLGAEEGLTIRLTLPKGLVPPPSEDQEAEWFRMDWGPFVNSGLVVGLVLAIYLLMWIQVGRDPSGRPVVVQYEPPKGFGPAALGYLAERGWEGSQVTAAVVDMAVKGILTIEKKGRKWILRRTDLPTADLSPEEIGLLEEILPGMGKVTLTGTSNSTVRKGVKEFRKILKRQMEKHYFVTNRKWFLAGLVATVLGFAALTLRARFAISPEGWFLGFWLSFWTMGVATLLNRLFHEWSQALSGDALSWVGAIFLTLFSIPFVTAEVVVGYILYRAVPLHLVVAAASLGFINVLFYHLLERPTLKGRGVLDHLEGFKRFLTATEEDRMNRLQGPDRSLELFERLLPFAISLGLENEWAGRFEGVLDAAALAESSSGGGGPGLSWYSGGRVESMTSLTGSLGGAFSSSLSASSAAPSSSGGGSGGGGSSGGGGGGGGGGGW